MACSAKSIQAASLLPGYEITLTFTPVRILRSCSLTLVVPCSSGKTEIPASSPNTGTRFLPRGLPSSHAPAVAREPPFRIDRSLDPRRTSGAVRWIERDRLQVLGPQ